MKNCSNRLGIILAAAAFALVLGSHGLRAQEQAAMFADADGLEPPDAGGAYALPADVAAVDRHAMWPELAALLSDPDGMNAPNTGFAYEIPTIAPAAMPGLVFDADGLEPPDIGMAYAVPFSGETVAERRTALSH